MATIILRKFSACFSSCGVAGGELGELGDPVDQLGDLLAEELGDLLAGGEGVLDGVVEQPGDDRGLVELAARRGCPATSSGWTR